ncbi:TldD/PmbA family protein [Oceanirhabdus sp. W0125-5]|uniref:TldD/PmbA family protein n=1 Tax=Oceanirhabdus sp. W0125-5 TaxID=2999116 RepID=UPI0022F2AA9F|nr:TldD/PmbA family protein [Oceanirhabdus sp. W0125-5]WBW97746.1 TldD/PmbA family protein [Oceanirhabdus sp. W0125-5]
MKGNEIVMEFDEFKRIINSRAQDVGFSEWEIFYKRKNEFIVNVSEEKVDEYKLYKNIIIYFRGKYEGKIGKANTEVMDLESIELLIQKVKENAKILDCYSNEELFEGEKAYPQVDLYNEEIEKLETREKINIAKKLEVCVYGIDKKVCGCSSCGLSTEEEETQIANSRALEISFKSNLIRVFVQPIVKDDNKTVNIYDEVVTRDIQSLDVEKLARKSVNEALFYLNSKIIERGIYTAILSSRSSAKILNAFKEIFSGEVAMKGRSLLGNKIGEKVFSNLVSIHDNPLENNGLSCRPFDDEGVACRNKKIVEKGELKTFLHNRESARKAKCKSTGNGIKDFFTSNLTVMPINMYIENGSKSFNEMIALLGNGIIIDELSSESKRISIETGNFSYRGRGLKVENGKITEPVDQIVVSGNYYELLENIIEVGSDLKFIINDEKVSIGSPCLMVKKLAIESE